MQHILNVLEPAENIDLLTLNEAKGALNIPASDTSKDAQLAFFITSMSDTLATMARRVFVYEKVQETFFDIVNGEKRIYFSRWPVVAGDIAELTAGGVDILPDLWPPALPPVPPDPGKYPPGTIPTTPSTTVSNNWVLEQSTGTLYRPPAGMWSDNVNSVYSGGYKLPEDAPPALKQLAILLTREAYYQMLLGAVAAGNIRMVAHKQARVMFFPSGAQAIAGAIGKPASSVAQRAVQDVLAAFIRYWV